MCSYISPTSLFPPTELLSVATVLKEIKNSEIKIIDSIANSFSPDEIKLKIKIKWKGKGISEKAFDERNMCIIECDKKYFRPTEVDNLKGTFAKAKKFLNGVLNIILNH